MYISPVGYKPFYPEAQVKQPVEGATHPLGTHSVAHT